MRDLPVAVRLSVEDALWHLLKAMEEAEAVERTEDEGDRRNWPRSTFASPMAAEPQVAVA